MDFFEIDFLDVESNKSGDAIAIRYQIDDQISIHVVDGGYQHTGLSLVEHIRKYYGDDAVVDRVIATHPDGDHLGGLRTVLAELPVGELWMLRPWNYAEEIIHRFETYNSIDALKSRLRAIYPNVAALEALAIEKNIPIMEPFQGSHLGAFRVLSPSKNLYLDMIVQSEKTPESAEEADAVNDSGNAIMNVLKNVANFIASAWGAETFSTEDTSSENEMSIVQFARIADQRILLTGDAGRKALAAAADYAPVVGLQLPGVDRFQVPHHGSRRNVSTELLDRILGPRLPNQPASGTFSAVVSSAKADEKHPRKSVVRAMIHRGANLVTTEGKTVCTSLNAPERGWYPLTPVSYPQEQEE